MPNNTIQKIKDQLGGHYIGDGSLMALCPTHTDKNPSLHISQEEDRLLCHCMAGCPQEAVIEALKEQGLWPKRNGSNPGNQNLPEGIPTAWNQKQKDGPPIQYLYQNHWTYYGLNGQTLGHVVRYNNKKNKQVVPFFRRNGQSWKAGGAKEPRPLYGLHKLSKNPEKPILISE